MSLKPDIVPQTQVIEQVKGLTEQKYKLSTQLDQIENKIKLIEASLSENDQIAERVKVLAAESLALFDEEWKRKSTFFPDIWLGAVEQAAAVAAPPKKK